MISRLDPADATATKVGGCQSLTGILILILIWPQVSLGHCSINKNPNYHRGTARKLNPCECLPSSSVVASCCELGLDSGSCCGLESASRCDPRSTHGWVSWWINGGGRGVVNYVIRDVQLPQLQTNIWLHRRRRRFGRLQTLFSVENCCFMISWSCEWFLHDFSGNRRQP